MSRYFFFLFYSSNHQNKIQKSVKTLKKTSLKKPENKRKAVVENEKHQLSNRYDKHL